MELLHGELAASHQVILGVRNSKVKRVGFSRCAARSERSHTRMGSLKLLELHSVLKMALLANRPFASGFALISLSVPESTGCSCTGRTISEQLGTADVRFVNAHCGPVERRRHALVGVCVCLYVCLCVCVCVCVCACVCACVSVCLSVCLAG